VASLATRSVGNSFFTALNLRHGDRHGACSSCRSACGLALGAHASRCSAPFLIAAGSPAKGHYSPSLRSECRRQYAAIIIQPWTLPEEYRADPAADARRRHFYELALTLLLACVLTVAWISGSRFAQG